MLRNTTYLSDAASFNARELVSIQLMYEVVQFFMAVSISLVHDTAWPWRKARIPLAILDMHLRSLRNVCQPHISPVQDQHRNTYSTPVCVPVVPVTGPRVTWP